MGVAVGSEQSEARVSRSRSTRPPLACSVSSCGWKPCPSSRTRSADWSACTSRGVISRSCGSAPAGVRLVTSTVLRRRSSVPRTRAGRRRRRSSSDPRPRRAGAAATGSETTRDQCRDENDSQYHRRLLYLHVRGPATDAADHAVAWPTRDAVDTAATRGAELLAAEPTDATAQQIHARLRDGGQAIGLATVYRTLALLSERGVIDALAHRPGETCYRLCGEGHHHHLLCGAAIASSSSTTARNRTLARQGCRRPGLRRGRPSLGGDRKSAAMSPRLNSSA